VPLRCGRQVDGFDHVGGGHAGLFIGFGDVGGGVGVEDADRTASTGEEESASVPNLAASRGEAAGSVGGGTLSGCVLVPGHPGQVAEYQK
jgi:hypothetical protein